MSSGGLRSLLYIQKKDEYEEISIIDMPNHVNIDCPSAVRDRSQSGTEQYGY